MSDIEKFSIKKINKIRKILLLYTDKDLKYQQKNKYKNFTKRFNNNDYLNRRVYSSPINIEQQFISISGAQNEIECKFEINNIYCSVSSRNNKFSSNSGIKEELILSILPKREISKDIIYKLEKNNEIKHINKFEKNYIIINNKKLGLKEKINNTNYLKNLYHNLKCVKHKRRRCSSTFKMNNNENKNGDIKETILEVKKKNKKNKIKKNYLI